MNNYLKICLITISVIVVFIILAVIIRQIVHIRRCRNFKPEYNSKEQVMRLNEELKAAGFVFAPVQEIFLSRHDAWQKRFGYRQMFDEMAPSLNMIIDSEPVRFDYDGRKWLLELWKGQYGIAVGAEIGIYVSEDGVHYDSVSDSEELSMSFLLIQGEEAVIRRNDTHWWLTGFKLGSFAKPEDLLMFAEIRFPNDEMCLAALDALRKLGYGRRDMSVAGNTIRIRFDKPYSKQPVTGNGITAGVRMRMNKINCKIFNRVTRRYTCMGDKIEYIKCRVPRLYRLILRMFALL